MLSSQSISYQLKFNKETLALGYHAFTFIQTDSTLAINYTFDIVATKVYRYCCKEWFNKLLEIIDVGDEV